MSVPLGLLPDRPSQEFKRRRLRGDRLCYVAIILALAGISPHAVDALTGLVKALRGESDAAEIVALNPPPPLPAPPAPPEKKGP